MARLFFFRAVTIFATVLKKKKKGPAVGSNHERKVTPQHEHPHHSCRQGGAQAGTRGRRLRRRRRAAESRLNSEDASPEDENNEGPDSEVECNRTCQAHRPSVSPTGTTD